jgi:hypothetical protein
LVSDKNIHISRSWTFKLLLILLCVELILLIWN